MVFTRLFQWGGVLLALGGAAFAAGGLLALVVPGGGLGGPLVPLLFFGGTVLSGPACVALYARYAERSGGLGLAGFLLTALGAALYSGPQLALLSGTLGAQGWHDVWGFAMGNVLLIGPPAFFIGLIVLGLTARRAGLQPRPIGLILGIGAGLWFVAYFLSAVPGLLTIASGLTGLGMAWAGWALWRGAASAASVAHAEP